MYWDNRVTKLLGIDYPIIQGGMAWVADADLAAAVSNGGGLGIIAAGNVPPDLLEQEILRARTLTARPFGLNVMLLSPTAEDAIGLAALHRVPVVTTGAGAPGKVIDMLKPLGTIVIPVIASVAYAKRVEKQGADAVVAEGAEAGGHIGESATMTLVPQVVDAIRLPVIAAGGVADGRGIAASFALGAEGVQVGTRFVCCPECNAHLRYKEAIIGAGDRSTVITGRRTGHPVRCLRNKLTQEFEKMEERLADLRELEEFGADRLRKAVIEGDIEWGSVMAGQAAGLIREVEPAAKIIRGMFVEAEEIICKLVSQPDGLR